MKSLAAIPLLVALVSTSYAIDLRPTVAEQIKIGKDAAAQIRKEEKILPDTDPRVQFIRKYGPLLVSKIPEAERKKRPFEYTFDVIDSKEINAFAIPGGPIFFYSGLIDKMSTQDQFVGVLGHEITHIRNQHWASQYADNLKRRLGLALILGLIGANDTLYSVADIVDTAAYLLPYSRRHESESDKFGFDMVIAVGMNPQGMSDVFKVFAAGKKGSDLETILSTHPDPAKRAIEIEKRLAKQNPKPPAQKRLPFETEMMKNSPNPSGTFLEIIQAQQFSATM